MPNRCFFLRVLGVILLAYGIFICLFQTFSFGNALPLLLGLVLYGYGRLSSQWQSRFPHFFHLYRLALLVFAITFGLTALLLTVTGKHKPENGADAILVLGAGLRGDEVSRSLAYRLDAAYDYYLQNPQCIFVLSGGQGENEWVPEAWAMRDYLLNKGMPEGKMLLADRSSRTMENFLFSKALLEDYFGGRPYTLVYVTNGFHVFRAGRIASMAGLTAQGLGAKTVPYLLPAQYLREYFSLLHFYTIDQLRGFSTSASPL